MAETKRVQGHSRDALIGMDHSHRQIVIRESSHLEHEESDDERSENRAGSSLVKEKRCTLGGDPDSDSCYLLGHLAKVTWQNCA